MKLLFFCKWDSGRNRGYLLVMFMFVVGCLNDELLGFVWNEFLIEVLLFWLKIVKMIFLEKGYVKIVL